MFKNFVILILKGFRYRPVRSWLTVLGIVIGIMLVVMIMALGDGIKGAISQTLQMFGSDLIVVRPGKETNPFAELISGQKFKEKDLLDLESINGVQIVVPMEITMFNVEYRGEKQSAMFHSQNWKDYLDVIESSQGFKLAEGRWPENESVKEIILGSKATELFKNKVRVGDDITIKAKKFKVVGHLESIGNQVDDNVIYISMENFRILSGSSGVAMAALIKISHDVNVDLVSQQIRQQLSKQEVIRDFSIITPQKAARLISDVLLIVELVLTIIALVSLVVGAVGIMNTMYTSVLERTKQIGVMKAIGASKDAILSLFLIESGAIGLIGGLAGIAAGIFMAYLAGLVATSYGIKGLFSFASLDLLGLLAILIITFITGVMAGILPARQAAKMEPAEALRYE